VCLDDTKTYDTHPASFTQPASQHRPTRVLVVPPSLLAVRETFLDLLHDEDSIAV
jgi:hypothetical protein